MAVNDKIKSADYNDIRKKVVGILGPGGPGSVDNNYGGNYGYGQTIRSSAVGLSTKVGVNDWANLYYDIYNAYIHIFGSVPGIVGPSENAIVQYSSPSVTFNSFADTIVYYRNTIAGSQLATRSKGSTNNNGVSWNALQQCTITVTFSTPDQARYFFNSGGQIRFTSSRSGGAVRSQNTAWTNLLNSVSAINGGAGPRFRAFGDPTDIVGGSDQYYFQTNAYQLMSSASASSPYGSNTFEIYARTPNTNNNFNGTDNQIQFLVRWVDGYTDPGNYYLDSPYDTDYVDGTLTIAVSTLFATGTLSPPGAGNFAVEDPTVSFSAITS